LHFKFALGVESAGGFVEDQNRSVFENGAGDADALFFAAAEATAAIADSRVTPVCTEKLNPDVVAMKSAKDRI
jgi:hypothetical protein